MEQVILLCGEKENIERDGLGQERKICFRVKKLS